MAVSKKSLKKAGNTLGFLGGISASEFKHPTHSFFIHSTSHFKSQWFLRLFNFYGIDFDLFNLLCTYSELVERQSKEKRRFAYHEMDEIFKRQMIDSHITQALGIQGELNLQSCIEGYAKALEDSEKEKYLTALLLGLFQGFVEHEESATDTAKYKSLIKQYIKKHNLQFTVIATNKALKSNVEVTDPNAAFLIYDRREDVKLGKKHWFRRLLKPLAIFAARGSVLIYSMALAIITVFALAAVLGVSLVSFGAPLPIIGLILVCVVTFLGLNYMYSPLAVNSVKDTFNLGSDLSTKQKIAAIILGIVSIFTVTVTTIILVSALVSALTGVGLPLAAALAIAGVLGVVSFVGFSLVMLQVTKGVVKNFGSKAKLFFGLFYPPKNDENTKGLKRVWQIVWHYLKALIITGVILVFLGFAGWAVYAIFTNPWVQGLIGIIHGLITMVMPVVPSALQITISVAVWTVVMIALLGKVIYNLNPIYSLAVYTGKVITQSLEIGASIITKTLNMIRHPIDTLISIPGKIKNAYDTISEFVITVVKHPVDMILHPMRDGIKGIWNAFLVGVPNAAGIASGVGPDLKDEIPQNIEEILRNAIDSIEQFFRTTIHKLAEKGLNLAKNQKSAETATASSTVISTSMESASTSKLKNFSLFSLKKPPKATPAANDEEGEGEKRGETPEQHR